MMLKNRQYIIVENEGNFLENLDKLKEDYHVKIGELKRKFFVFSEIATTLLFGFSVFALRKQLNFP